MDRIKKLCSYLSPCKSFADVACDHGYCAEYMLKNDLCESAYISDVSPKCLNKARTLLSEYITSGRCTAVCCDGLENIPPECGQILIAGIGGEEIIKILKKSFIPKSFVFQPMKNAEALRAYLIGCGCEITVDDIFTDGKNYYFIIKGGAHGNESYTKTQLAYGRDSLKNPVFRSYLSEEIQKKISYLGAQMSENSRAALQTSIREMQRVLDYETDRNI